MRDVDNGGGAGEGAGVHAGGCGGGGGAPLARAGWSAARWIETPLGPVRVRASGAGVVAVEFVDGAANAERARDEPSGGSGAPAGEHAARCAAELLEYFAGRRREFTVPLDLRGTAFERLAWAELRRVPYGATSTYGQQAAAMGRARAARAVGRANGRNPAAIVVPCHRVIGAGGALTGYGGGLERKRWLLRHEAAADGAAGTDRAGTGQESAVLRCRGPGDAVG